MLHYFPIDIDCIEPPKQFTWPFHYVPHELCRMAANLVMQHVATLSEWQDEINQGKMFGVLVVRDKAERLGFLAAFRVILPEQITTTILCLPCLTCYNLTTSSVAKRLL